VLPHVTRSLPKVRSESLGPVRTVLLLAVCPPDAQQVTSNSVAVTGLEKSVQFVEQVAVEAISA
jgi:hypothetical protein